MAIVEVANMSLPTKVPGATSVIFVACENFTKSIQLHMYKRGSVANGSVDLKQIGRSQTD